MESMFVLIFYIGMRIYSIILFLIAMIMVLFQLFVVGFICALISDARRGDGVQLANLFNTHQQNTLQRQQSITERKNYLSSIKQFSNAFLVDSNNDCAICYEKFKQGEELVKLHCSDKAEHIYHFHCLNEWISQGNKTCPICRTEIKKLAEP